MSSVLIVAAEASSVVYGQRLLEYWSDNAREVKVFGVGSRAMAEQGLEVLGYSEELGDFDFVDVLRHGAKVRRIFNSLVGTAKERRPQFALLLDYPHFNLRLAKKLKKLGIPVVYYISPEVWAWRRGRLQTIKKFVDKMLVIFPFELEIYKAKGIPVTFVGHPLLDEVDEKYFSKDYFNLNRSRYGVRPREKLLGLMPGSRYSELKFNLNTQIEVASQLVKEDPQLRVALLVAPPFDIDEIKEMLPRLNFSLIFLKAQPFEMIHMTDAILCSSGTATLLVGLMQKPLVIMYKLRRLTALFCKIFIKVKYFGIVNYILDKEVGEEYFQERANIRNLVPATKKILYDESYIRSSLSDLKNLKNRLGDLGATSRVAKELERFFK